MRISNFIFIFISLCFSAQEKLTVEEAVRIALEKNYSVVVAKNSKEIGKIQNNLGNAGMSPSVSLGGNYTFANVNSYQEFSSGATQERSGAVSNNMGLSAAANWIVFDGLKMFAVKKRLGLNEGLTDIQLKQQMENTVYAVILGYYDIVRINQLIAAQKKGLTVLDERKKIARVKLDAGSDSKVDLLLVQTEENKAKSELMRTEIQLLNAKVNLNNLMTRSPEADFDVADTIVINYQPGQEDLKRSGEKNTNLLLSRQNELIIGQTIHESRSANLPLITLGSAYNFSFQKSQAGFLFLSKQNGIALGAGLSWLILNGGKNKNITKERQILLLDQKLLSEQIKLNVDAMAFVSYQSMLTYKRIFEMEKQNLSDARELMLVSMERYRVGKAAFLETSESHKTLEDAQTRCINALYDCKKAETDLLKTNGGLVK